MTRLRGASASSYDAARGAGSDRSHFHRSKLPPNAPEVVVLNTVDVSDPAQVLLWYRDERRRQFNLLVRRYKNQLLYGCQDPGCQTPTCASCRRRITEGPYRRYTELSARTLACYLASVDNAEAGLCCNAPRVPYELYPRETHRRPKRRIRTPIEPAQEPGPIRRYRNGAEDVPPGSSRLQGSSKLPESGNSAAQGTPQELPPHEQQVTLSDNDQAGAAQRLKDPKSFTQNLFDTLSLRMIEWLPLRRSPNTLDTDIDPYHSLPESQPPKSEPERTPSHPERTRPRLSRQRTPQNAALSGGTPHTPTGTSQNTALELTVPITLTEMDQWRRSGRSSLDEKAHHELKPARKIPANTHANNDEMLNVPSPPALRHRPQKHRGRTGDIDDSADMPVQEKKERRVSWDGAKCLNNVQFVDFLEPVRSVEEYLPSQAQSPSERRPRRRSLSRRQSAATVQSVSHLNSEVVDGLAQMIASSEDEKERWSKELACIESTGSFEDSDWRFANPRQRQAYNFIAQSVFYALGSTKQILKSFQKDTVDPSESDQSDSTCNLDLRQLQPSFAKLLSICPRDLVFHSLWSAMESLFVPPHELSISGRRSRRSSCNSSTSASVPTPIIRRSSSVGMEHLTDANAADVATVTMFALASALPKIDAPTWRAILQMRAAGGVASGLEMQKHSVPRSRVMVETADMFEHELALRLVDRLVRGLTARLAFNEISKARPIYSRDTSKNRKDSALDLLVGNLIEEYNAMSSDSPDQQQPLQPGAPSFIAEWLRTLLLRAWDGNPEMPKSSSAGGAVQILAKLYKERNRLGLAPEDFHTSFLSERLEQLDMPVEWLGRLPNNKTMHLLSYPFLFPPSALVIYFRALNYAVMSKYYEAALTTTRHVTQTAFGPIHIQDDVGLLARMKTSMTTYLVLTVRRDSVLTDALNQLWRRERRELMRPLKVQMGMDEGEEGLDHGGVQQEFFRVLMAEALDPAYGMFTLDGRTRISWFQPCSLEPLYKFELLGLLMSLAVYNGLTLPINFPTAFYRKLLGLKVKQLDHIRDGWPDLAKGLEGLLTWDEGDVGDIFLRTYEFSYEVFGNVETVDMQKIDKDAPWPIPLLPLRPPLNGTRSLGYSPPWSEVHHYTDHVNLSPPSSMAAETAGSYRDVTKSVDPLPPVQSPTPPAEEACLVTNANRGQFVKDYIFWLTDKSIRPQFEAFAKGFYTCLDRTALSIFTAESLKTVVEGIQTIDVRELERHARYEGGFSASHRVIRDFWNIVRRYPAEKRAQLLEFVTASDRVPVNGIASIMFVIQKNGVGDARLPTSLTCFGRLLLPEYSSRSVLEEKLSKALENARGFGVA
ncbi:HECT domain protein [Aspergillus homomorphus CBS 101889]|uniref:HECT-type E3 ubiquitin transferase n=1 Tax=Aspergillus homomorphus (strain CBS 101889) TaxID=1450537 RepID=A0A395I8J3_ASPHC|nr:HECT domain protein [Aspergillus homomorphus CBS 101889]RAL16306.1 HECT domain protein [Aspergillus homomorphus CBS 101889]